MADVVTTTAAVVEEEPAKDPVTAWFEEFIAHIKAVIMKLLIKLGIKIML